MIALTYREFARKLSDKRYQEKKKIIPLPMVKISEKANKIIKKREDKIERTSWISNYSRGISKVKKNKEKSAWLSNATRNTNPSVIIDKCVTPTVECISGTIKEETPVYTHQTLPWRREPEQKQHTVFSSIVEFFKNLF